MAESDAGNAERLDALFPQPEPPACPEGWSVGPPTFVGVGAPRCGTTWWHRMVVRHPDVCFVRGLHVKEVHFFGPGGSERETLSAEEIARYHSYFPRSPDLQNVGEWTPDYMYSRALPRQLAEAAPDARMLVMLRDPVDRFASGFTRGRRLAAESGIGGADAELAARNVESGMYFEPVAMLLEACGRDRVLILQYERCRAQYPAELRRTHEFLGLDPDRGPAPPVREPRERSLPAAELERLAERYAPDVRKLADLLPELDVAWWPNVARLV